MTGIATHSQADHNYIIFSVYQFIKDDTVNHNRTRMWLDNLGIGYVEAEGMYKNTFELCFVVHKRYENIVREIVKKYNQECYLVLNNHKHGTYAAIMVYPNYEEGSFEYEKQGYFMSVPKEVAMQQEGWCYRPDMDVYWTIAPTDDRTMGAYGGLNCVSGNV